MAASTSSVAPDGSPVAVYLRLPPADEPELVHSAIPAGADILELGCGPGRLTHAFVALGHRVVAVDESEEMLRHVEGAERVRARIETLDLGRRFDCVLLASNLVNSDRSERRAFLACCGRHVAPEGCALIQRLEPQADWLAREGRTWERNGVSVTWRAVHQVGRTVSAVAEYRIGDIVWEQPFTSHLLDDHELADELASVGLRLARVLDEQRTWIEAHPV